MHGFAGASAADGVAVGLVRLAPLATVGLPRHPLEPATTGKASFTPVVARQLGEARYGWKAASDTVALS